MVDVLENTCSVTSNFASFFSIACSLQNSLLAASRPHSLGFKTSGNGTNETIDLDSKEGGPICDIFTGLFLCLVIEWYHIQNFDMHLSSLGKL